jgi:serine/threonine protein kinase
MPGPRDNAVEVKLAAGTAFGRYQIVRLIGEGGMGVVYEALHLELRKRVAIKILKLELARDEMARIRFVREGEAAARVRHSHVVDVSDVGNHDDMPYLVMEFLEGEELETRLRRDGRFEIEGALDVLLPVIAAVAAGHDQGVIHRDLKPQNIFLARQANGEVTPKVLDFGVSKLMDPHGATVNLTVAGALYGTVQYMAPEQADGSGRVDPRSDEYALAAILSESLTGRRAFPGDNLLELLRRICAGDFAHPRTLRADIPAALEATILRGMSLQPEARFPSLYEFGGALLPFASLRARVLWEATFSRERATAAAADAPETETARSPSSGQTLPLPPTPGGGTVVLQRTREFPPETPPAPVNPTLAATPAPPVGSAATAAAPATPAGARVVAAAPVHRFTVRRMAIAAGAIAAIALLVVVALARRPPQPEPDGNDNAASTRAPRALTTEATPRPAAPTPTVVPARPPVVTAAPTSGNAAAVRLPDDNAPARARATGRARVPPAHPTPAPRATSKRAVMRTRNNAPVTD